MNQRIRELAEQASKLVRTEHPELSKGLTMNEISRAKIKAFLISEYDLEKFAELIVRECMSCCDVVEKVEWIEPTTYEFGVQACKVKIQTHFGVKE